MAAQPKRVNYDPDYCLQEHLNYFNENVASKLEKDFDLVFSPLAPVDLQKPVAPPSLPALPVKHIYINKVIILPKDFVFPGQAALQKPSVGPTAILPCPVTSDPLKSFTKNDKIPKFVPSSPTCIKQQAQVQENAIFEVPNPMLAISAAEAAKTKEDENSLPLPVVSLVANPIPSSEYQDQAKTEAKDQTSSTHPQSNPDTTTSKPATLVAPSPVTVPCPAAVAVAVSPGLAPVAAPSSARPMSPEVVPTTTTVPVPAAAAAPVAAPIVVCSATVTDNDEHSDEDPQTPTGSKKRGAPKSGDIRRERNRKHAKKSRQRKKEFNQNLEDSINALKMENEFLLAKLNMTPEEVLLAAKPEPEQAQSSIDSNGKEADDLLSALQNLENRVLGDDAMAALQLLFKH